MQVLVILERVQLIKVIMADDMELPISRLAQVMKNWHVSFIMKRVGMDLLNCWMNIIMRVRVRFH